MKTNSRILDSLMNIYRENTELEKVYIDSGKNS